VSLAEVEGAKPSSATAPKKSMSQRPGATVVSIEFGSPKEGAMSELPTGTVTFLFTDVEGSTRLWEQHPDAMRGALARHDELVTAAVERRGGQVVKGMGDGVYAAFASADAAVAAAVDAQRALDKEPWGPIGSLRVRMGLRTAVADQRGADYFGPVLNRAVFVPWASTLVLGQFRQSWAASA
jgi:class 3 adenylate cyclase